MRISKDAFIAFGIATVAALGPVTGANAQSPKQPDTTTAPGRTVGSAVDACNQFRNALKAPAPAGQSVTERAQQNLGGIADAGQQGITCAQALAKYFEALRKGGAKGAWSDIEREMDLVIDTYRSLLERIEGTGGAYEEGRRAVTVLEEQIKDMVARRGETHQNVVDARVARDGISSGLEQTKKLKAILDSVLVDMQSRKSEIVESEGIQRYSAAQRALEAMNEGLSKVIEELVKAIKKPGT